MTDSLSYGDKEPDKAANSLKWSAVGLAGKHGVIALFSLVLARLLGPEAYGLVAQATIYITLTTLLLDQGLAAALMSAGTIPARTVGAVATLNIVLSVLLGGVTALAAPLIANFFNSPNLSAVVSVLGAALIFKGLAIVPRMLLGRRLDLRSIALSDLVASVTGGGVGVVMALTGSGYWALVAQSVTMDALAAVLLIAAARPPRPNFHLALVRPLFVFSTRVFGSNLLSYTAGNSDSLLIGRYLGATALASYDVAFRVLRMPVDMTGQILNRVLFPLIAGKRHRGEAVAPAILRSVAGTAFVTFPLMAVVGTSAPDLVPSVLGDKWLSVIPILMVFALSGARQSVTTINTPVLLGLNQAGAQLRFSVAAACVQVAAIIIGLFWGTLGVAIGYTVAGFVLTPAIARLQKRFAKVGYRAQIGAIAPPIHGSIWAAVSYLVATTVANSPGVWNLAIGGMAAVLTYLMIMFVVHRDFSIRVYKDVRAVLRQGKKPSR